MDILSQLNDSQRQAAACIEGPVMIIAGAGSGKTKTLTHRIAHLIELGVDPFNILALTFTNKAVQSLFLVQPKLRQYLLDIQRQGHRCRWTLNL